MTEQEVETVRLIWPDDETEALRLATEYADEHDRTNARRAKFPLPEPTLPIGHVVRELRDLMKRNEMPESDWTIRNDLDGGVGRAGRVPIIGRDRGALPGESPEDLVGPDEELLPRASAGSTTVERIPSAYWPNLDEILRGDPTWEKQRAETIGPTADMTDLTPRASRGTPVSRRCLCRAPRSRPSHRDA